MNWDLVSLKTSRLILRPVLISDASVIYCEFTPEITRYLIAPSPKSLEDSKAFIHFCIEGRKAKSDFVLVILLNEDGPIEETFVGLIGVHDTHTASPSFGLWLRKALQGKGYGKEAALALKEWIMEHLHFDYLVYPVDKANIASIKIIHSLGGVLVGERKEVNGSGYLLDELVFHIFAKKPS